MFCNHENVGKYTTYQIGSYKTYSEVEEKYYQVDVYQVNNVCEDCFRLLDRGSKSFIRKELSAEDLDPFNEEQMKSVGYSRKDFLELVTNYVKRGQVNFLTEYADILMKRNRILKSSEVDEYLESLEYLE